MVVDTHGRPLRSLRISVTDRCNLRCTYCMPERDYVWLPRDRLLSFQELTTLATVFAGLGVTRLRLTGGEPLIRKDLPVLLGMLASIDGIDDLALTTNGILLPGAAADLVSSGLRRVTVSLDTIRPDRFRLLAGRDQLSDVLAGIEAAASSGFDSVKINTVVIRGTNDDEIIDILDFAAGLGAEVRFIEYMDVGGATRWSGEKVVSRLEILDVVARARGPVRPLAAEVTAPADRFAAADGTVFGVISSTTAPFCGTCDRSRLTADGMFYTCLYARHGLDLRQVLRGGASPREVEELLGAVWRRRTDRGAEERRNMVVRGALASASELREDPHLEMHTRGG